MRTDKPTAGPQRAGPVTRSLVPVGSGPAVETSDALAVARRVAVIVLAAEVALLALTGVWLVLNYLPDSAANWTLLGRQVHGGREQLLRIVHRYLAHLAVVTSLGVGGIVLAEAIVDPGRPRRVFVFLLGPLVVLAVVAASLTGYLLPWDHLALWAVKVNGNVRGYGPVFSAQTRFVLLGSVEVGKESFWHWFLTHTVGIPLVVIGLGLVCMRVRRRRPASPV